MEHHFCVDALPPGTVYSLWYYIRRKYGFRFDILPSLAQIDGDSGATIWTYQSSSEGVSKGRAFAIDVIGADAIVVGGTTTGSDTSSTGMFSQGRTIYSVLGVDWCL